MYYHRRGGGSCRIIIIGEVSSRYTSLSHTRSHAPKRKHTHTHTRTPLSLTDTHTHAPNTHTKHHRNISEHLDIPLQQHVQTSLHRHHDQHQEPPWPIGMTVSRHTLHRTTNMISHCPITLTSTMPLSQVFDLNSIIVALSVSLPASRRPHHHYVHNINERHQHFNP